MPRDPLTYIWDALHAAKQISAFIDGRTWEEYIADTMLSSAVERQFEIIGEALNNLSRENKDEAEKIPDLGKIVAFRNVLIHGYANIDSSLVWSFATERLDSLIELLNSLIREGEKN